MWFWAIVGDIVAPVIWLGALLILVVIIGAPFYVIERRHIKRRASKESGPTAMVDIRSLPPIVGELQAMACQELGNRALRVNQILATADPSPRGLESAVDELAGLKVLFVDEDRMNELVQRMRARISALEP